MDLMHDRTSSARPIEDEGTAWDYRTEEARERVETKAKSR
jgi:hypothetical protein